MKKISFRYIFAILLIFASISAQIFIAERGTTTSSTAQIEQSVDIDSLEEEPHFQLDIEILKALIEQGKNHLPVISNKQDF